MYHHRSSAQQARDLGPRRPRQLLSGYQGHDLMALRPPGQSGQRRERRQTDKQSGKQPWKLSKMQSEQFLVR